MCASFKELIRVVSNERSCPLLLEYNADVVDSVAESIKAQQAIVQDLKEKLSTLDEIHQKFVQAMELEIFRWSYLIRVYMITRFKKIQSLIGRLIIPMENKLTNNERNFCINYEEALSAGLDESNLAFSEEIEDLSPFVFFRALKDKGPTLLSSSETNETMEIFKDQIYFARLEHVKPLIDQREAVLI
ncbi:Synthetic lethal mutants of dpb11-1 five family protein [Tritrichomonas foetus]|uniref:Synthetic lethal mutants of dpb11-1 five family protein n=1 Tax=Tritrichomonas foetus TaxID=1144522 RepID=UPI000910F134|nr:Synthetic lethal mutants of dpb11-1 five family protein [Tritrichomonas foetus]|eukprot:OHS96131.1 Synthetic lethal mutants of dpb11-1 five family protein [Tritrichomonas foetus]